MSHVPPTNPGAAGFRRDITTRDVRVRAASIDEKDRSVEFVFTTERMVRVFDMRSWEVIDEILISRGMTLPDQLPLCDTHMRWSVANVLGSIRGLRVEQNPELGEVIVGRAYFAEGDPIAESAWRKVQQGHLRDFSAGYMVEKATDIPAGQSGVVDGKNYTAGARRLRISQVSSAQEGSLVPIGADDRAKAREQTSTSTKETTMQGTTRTESEGSATAAAAQTENKNATNDAGQRSIDPASVAAIQERSVKAERERSSKIRAIAPKDVAPEIVERAINEGTTVEAAAITFLEHQRNNAKAAVGSAPGAIVRNPQRDNNVEVVTAALMLRCSMGDERKLAKLPWIRQLGGDERERAVAKLAEQAHRSRNMPLVDILREAARLMGGDVMHGYGAEEIFRETCRLDYLACQQRAGSTGALSAIFTSVATAMLLAGWDALEDTTQGWTSEGDLPDFKLTDRVMLDEGSGLTIVAPGKSADHANYSAFVENYRIRRYGKQWRMDEQDIINDSIKALTEVPKNIVSLAGDLRPNLVYSILLANAALVDTVALFHASHGNLLTGATSVLTPTAAKNGVAAMLKQTSNGRSLNINAGYCIVPPDLRFQSRQIWGSPTVGPTGVIAATQGELGTQNPLYEEGVVTRTDNRVGVGGVVDPTTGETRAGTTTNWFLAAKGGKRTIEVGYLRGQKTPELRGEASPVGSWGFNFDVKYDIGAKALDFRGLLKSDGA